ncbi:CHAT domain-containing protein [Roseateles oligotrophus]|uniref:CHAT domain-containing protein n=1 Tax=Roseateles oligotrophus TaxID=1769250 RepID=A0ABT2YB51_9BURK|nr:CHAT domain-containing protein [Roseateles oligotrophus]MCV2367529.1 CHAT domain-containing protein [Roseateles oligotrophus]
MKLLKLLASLGLTLLFAASARSAELPKLLKEALQEYQTRLPEVRKLQWLDLQSTSNTERSWNEATQQFLVACRQQAEDCTPLLHRELKVLDQSLRVAPVSEGGQAAASTLSAIADLCQGFPNADRPIDICRLNLRLHEAALRWLDEGNELLFLAYLRRYDMQRTQYLDWLQSQGQAASASTLAALPDMPPWVRAQQLEFTGNFGAARSAWFTSYAIASQQPPNSPLAALLPQAALQMARLSWLLGEQELAQEFEHLHSQQFKTNGCPELALAWRVEIARSNATGQWPARPADKLAAIIQGSCGFTQAMVELGADALLLNGSAHRSEAAAAMGQALRACKSSQCATYRLAQMQALLSALQEPTPALPRTRLDGLAQLGSRPESDLRLNWALGADLLRSPTFKQDGLSLLLATQRELLLRSSTTQSASFEDQRDLSRYDGLHRLIAAAAVQQAQTLAISRTETLRAQTLLRRLRLERLKTQLADTREEPADARYQTDLARAQQLKSMSAQISGAAIGGWLQRMADDFMAMAEQQHIEALAARKLKQQGDSRIGSWLDRAIGLSAAARLADQDVDPLAGEADSVAPDEAYLSWLQVPGGYVASVVNGKDRQLSNHWIAVSAAQQASLKLYRDLLRSGAAKPSKTAGLSLRGRPVWRKPDGSYSVSTEAPAGAKQVQQVEDIGRELYALLLAPTQSRWQQARRLIISPDGGLAQLPFETLWQGGQPLLASMDISYVQSLAVHAELKRRAERTKPLGSPLRLLTLADPSYTLPKVDQGEQAKQASTPEWMAELEWQALPGTRQESEALLALFKQPRQIVGSAATQSALLTLQKSGELGAFRVLHFATHGYVDDQRSALVLSMSEGMENAYLQDGTIARLSLRSELVLLSACDTGLGRSQSGEGVMGLPYAFMLAGNTDTLMSLWSVDDRGTAAFIPAFMTKLRSGLDVVTALNVTKREFSAGLFGEAFRDPRIWASFVLYGVPLKL